MSLTGSEIAINKICYQAPKNRTFFDKKTLKNEEKPLKTVATCPELVEGSASPELICPEQGRRSRRINKINHILSLFMPLTLNLTVSSHGLFYLFHLIFVL